MGYGLFWLIVIVVIVGQALLVRSAWYLRKGTANLPPGVPRSHGATDLAWTLATAGLTGMMLYYAYHALL